MGFFWKDEKQKNKALQSPSAESVLSFLRDQFLLAVNDLNATLADESQKLQVQKVFSCKQTLRKDDKKEEAKDVLRFSISNRNIVLSVRGVSAESVEAFLMPAHQFNLVPASEYPSRLKIRLEWRPEQKDWLLDGSAITENDLKLLVLSSTNDILKYSHAKADLPKEGVRLRIGELSLTTGLRDLLFEKAQLISDLLAQQERMQTHIAQELHDSVIANLLFLRREISDGKVIDKNKATEAIDAVVQDLREICTDFSSNDLKTWGLWDAVCALCDRLSERSGIGIEVESNVDLPKIPHDVSLQIYRMLQESINNAIKHAHASEILLQARKAGKELELAVVDDGDGFDQGLLPKFASARGGGMGLPVLRERSEYLSTLGFPATITIESKPGAGTTVRLRVDLSSL